MDPNSTSPTPEATVTRHEPETLSSFHHAKPIHAERVKINGVEVCPRPADPAALAEVARIEKAYDDKLPYSPAS